MVDDGLTKQEFTQAFGMVRQYISTIEGRLMEEIDMLRSKYKDLSEFSSVIDNLEKLKSEQQRKLTAIDTRVAAIKDGAPGKKGDKGDEGKTPSKKELVALIKPLIPEPIPGPPGYTPVKGVDYNDGADAVVDTEQLMKDLLVKIPIPDFPDFEPDITALKNDLAATRRTPGWGAHPLTIAQSGAVKAETARYLNFTGTGVSSVTTNPDGTIDVSLTAGAAATTYTETPTGTINGNNKAFTTVHAITTIYSFALNSAYIHAGEYSVVGSTITFTTAPDASLSGTSFTIVYS